MKAVPSLIGAALMAAPFHPVDAAEQVTALNAAQQTQSMVAAVSQAWLVTEWRSYATRFVTPDGRVIDNANGGISHSESQGYGMLLAVKAGDRAQFDRIWQWTHKHLQVRPDGLLAWKWNPTTAAVADTNNASDGDILVAWALRAAAARFARPDYRTAAVGLARAIATNAVLSTSIGLVLKPGVTGFEASEQPDGPVINLSYWVFPAFPALADLAPDFDWAAMRRSGLSLLDRSRFGSFGLPTDWEGLASGTPKPAANFPPAFGYNAIRIPLYLALDGEADAKAALRRFAGPWAQTASLTQLVQVREAPVTVPLGQPGYSAVMALARCVASGAAVPPEAISARNDFYYPETLRLLSVIALQERYSACL